MSFYITFCSLNCMKWVTFAFVLISNICICANTADLNIKKNVQVQFSSWSFQLRFEKIIYNNAIHNHIIKKKIWFCENKCIGFSKTTQQCWITANDVQRCVVFLYKITMPPTGLAWKKIIFSHFGGYMWIRIRRTML